MRYSFLKNQHTSVKHWVPRDALTAIVARSLPVIRGQDPLGNN